MPAVLKRAKDGSSRILRRVLVVDDDFTVAPLGPRRP
jgi:hypothetical protein